MAAPPWQDTHVGVAVGTVQVGAGVAVVQVCAERLIVPLLQLAVALPVVGAALSVSVTLLPLAPPAYDALHVDPPTDQVTLPSAAPGAAAAPVVHVCAESVIVPLLQLAVALPVVG